ncbi:RNA polymerase sigma-70 factor (ECF subfamily) [Tamilnaduibacter salinus]|nr:RNA polymerase sigma factor [Tamilnaduibacter salinus]PVY77378.1 RNA polymerase sigma-70 factor (ECF subfamily) [Tamilnaduibacter salinus]
MTALPPEQDDETALIEALRRGDEAAFRDAVRLHTPGMLAVARYYLDSASAEEVVQDCWIKVVTAIGGFQGRSGLKTWLHRIVSNQCRNRLRDRKRESDVSVDDMLDPELASRFGENRRWSVPPTLQHVETADRLLESDALRDCLDHHLSALPEQQRSALILYEAHQHQSSEVCNILEVSASNLRVLLHRARQKIFLMVERFQETGEC